MNLRTRFTILILGSIFIPSMIMGLIFWFLSSYMSLSDPAWEAKRFQDQLEQIDTFDEFSAVTEDLNEHFFAIMMDRPELFSSNESEDALFSISPHTGDDSLRFIVSSQKKVLEDGSEVLVLFGMNFMEFKGRFFPLLFLATSVVAMIVLSLLTIRSINKSISRLEDATGKIAEGDLNVRIDTSGSDKFGSLARSLDTMRLQVKAEYDRRNRFFMGVSHDLKTPLASITGYADALIEGMADDRKATEKYLKIIQDKSHQLEDRITHLIHYLKLSNYDFQTSLTESSLADFLIDFAEVLAEEADISNKLFQWDVNLEKNFLVSFDQDLLRRALENLVQNAYRYGDSSYPVYLGCRLNYDAIEIVIENKGGQIPEDQLELIFEPFYRSDQSRKGDGFGLGLASVKSIIESHGWSINARSSENRTSFTITLPRV